MTDIRIAPHSFLAYESGHPGLASLPAQLLFPSPFTLGDYLKWERAVFPIDAPDKDDDELDVDDLLMMRQYRGAMAVGTLEPVDGVDLEAPDGPGSVSLANSDPSDDDLPIVLVGWVNACAGEYIGCKVIVQHINDVRARRHAWKSFSPKFEALAWYEMLPDLVRYPGASITFKEPLGKAAYRAWRRAMRVRGNLDARDPENRTLARQWRAAVTLIDKWDVKGVPWDVVKKGDGYGVPLEVASWVVDAADTFLTKRLNPKK